MLPPTGRRVLGSREGRRLGCSHRLRQLDVLPNVYCTARKGVVYTELHLTSISCFDMHSTEDTKLVLIKTKHMHAVLT